MKFTTHRDSLLDCLQRIQSVVEKRNTVQILSNFLCELKDGVLSLSATDLEVGIKVTLPVEMEGEGKITLSAKHFVDIVKELPSKPLKISKKSNDWVEIVSGKSRFNILSLSADEYPALPAFEKKEYFKAKISSLRQMITMTSFAVSTDATRYHLTGVHFERLENNLFRMTATDGHRLSFVDQEVFLNAPEFKRGIIVPYKGLMELKKLLDKTADEEAEIGIAFDQGYFFAQMKDTYLFVRLIEGEYPDYRQVIPKTPGNKILVDKDSFVSALRRVSLLAHEKSRGIKLNIANNQIEITTNNPDMGDAREEVDIAYTGEAIEIGFNARYLLDCLEQIETKKLELQVKDRLSPGVIQGDGLKNHTYIIMPMRI